MAEIRLALLLRRLSAEHERYCPATSHGDPNYAIRPDKLAGGSPKVQGGNIVKGIVAAGYPVTVDAAAEILSDGGNAFDAVIAGLLACLTPETVLASLGGGGYLMAYASAAGRARLYDFFVDTPSREPACS